MNDLSQAELQLLKQISENLSHLNERMATQESLSRQALQQMAALQERVANTGKLEARLERMETNLTTRLNNHSDRITELTAGKNRLEGAVGVVEWANKLWPLFAALIGVIGVYLGFRP